MNRARFNHGVFVLEGLNAVGTTFYITYLFFFLKHQFGFTSQQNLMVCALNGLIFAPFALVGGRFGQRFGYLNALKLGSAVMVVSLLTSAFLTTVTGLMIGMVLWTVGWGTPRSWSISTEFTFLPTQFYLTASACKSGSEPSAVSAL